MSLERLTERLARVVVRSDAEPVAIPTLSELTIEPLANSLERLRPWWMAPTPYGAAHVFRERLTVGSCLSGAFTTPGALCHHPLHTLLGDDRLSGFRLEDALYLDIEATGLSHGAGTFAFLIGIAYFEAGEVVLEQLFMNDPSAELPVLSRFLDLLDSRPFLVSFNGKSYDLSVLESRLIVTRLLSRQEAGLKLRPHLDLLHVSRQAYKGIFTDTRLQTLERRVLGMSPEVRANDVPGSLVPALYFHFLRTGHASYVDGVLEHNRTDVLSMVALTEHLVGLFTRPGGAANVLANLGRSALRRRLPDRAARLLLEALEVGDLSPEWEQRAVEDLVAAARRSKQKELLAFAKSRLAGGAG